MTLKELLGNSYHDGMTYEEVEKALDGKNIVDLKTGKYVDVDKYNNAVNDLKLEKQNHAEEITKHKDYDELVKYKADNEAKIAETALRGKLEEAGFKKEFLDFAVYQVNSGVIANDDKIVDNAKAFLGSNPSYGNVKEENPTPTPTPEVPPIINTNIGFNNGQGEQNPLPQGKALAWNKNRSF